MSFFSPSTGASIAAGSQESAGDLNQQTSPTSYPPQLLGFNSAQPPPFGGGIHSVPGPHVMPYQPAMYPGQALMPPNPPMPPMPTMPDPHYIQSPPVMAPAYSSPTVPSYQGSSHAGFFSNARDFSIANATMVEQYFSSGAPVFVYLEKKWASGALVDSSARPNPARCLPETRNTARALICDWGLRDQRLWRMFWILGSAAIGKSALAQTIAEHFRASGCLGATFFFSRPNHRDDANTVFPTIAWQLATKSPHYKSIITEQLANNPAILEMDLSTQFHQLIIDPFRRLMHECPRAISRPLLIILDGLDECRERSAQRRFIELIGAHVRSVKDFPLLWMICSRPESHLRTMVLNPMWDISCHHHTLEINEKEAQADTRLILHKGIFDIRRTFEYQLNDDWPPEHYVENIACAASGHLGFVSFIVRFVADEQASDPVGRLERCIRFLDGFGAPGAISPLQALDHLYYQIFSEIPAEISPNTMNIFAFFILYPDAHLSALRLANFLGLEQPSFYRSLDSLYAVIDVPPPKEADTRPLFIYHASLSDFLKDPRRSTRFCLNDDELHFLVARRSLQLLKQKTVGHTTSRNLKWITAQSDSQAVLDALQTFARDNVWKACCKTPQRNFPALIKELEGLNLDGLTLSEDYNEFLRWQYFYDSNST